MKSRLSTRLTLYAVFLLGLFLRFYTLGSKSIWLDEAFTLWVAKHPLSEVWSWIARIDQHPPLYYLLLSLWVKLWGDSEVAIRSLPALLSTATLPLFYLTARKVANANGALLALFLLAVSPFHLHYAQENRMYSLLALAGCGAIYFTLGIVNKVSIETGDWRFGDWRVLGLAFSQAVGMWTHNTFVLFFPLALLIGLVLGKMSGGLAGLRARLMPCFRFLLTAEVLALLLWLPWTGNFVRQSIKVDQEFWIQPTRFGQILDALQRLLADHTTVPSLARLWILCALILALAGGWWLIQQGKLAGSLLLSFWLTPFLAEILIGLRRPLLHPPSLIWTSLPLYLLIAVGMTQLKGKVANCELKIAKLSANYIHRSSLRQMVVVAALGLVIISNGMGLSNYYQFVHKEQWADVARYVHEQAELNDLILFNATWVQLPFEYYAQRDGFKAELRGMPVDLFERGVTEPKMRQEDLPYLRQLIANRRQVWLIYSHSWYTDPQQLTLNELRSQLVEKESKQFDGVEVYEFER
ncbi:MAG: glycosyltransferase family 39 protein [Caldilineaceae bacterium]